MLMKIKMMNGEEELINPNKITHVGIYKGDYLKIYFVDDWVSVDDNMDDFLKRVNDFEIDSEFGKQYSILGKFNEISNAM